MKRGSYGGKGAVAAWVLSIAARVSIDYVRKDAGVRVVLVPDGYFDAVVGTCVGEDAAVEDALEQDGRVSRLRSEVAALPPRQSEVVRRHSLEGEPVAEISQTTGIAEGTVRRAHSDGVKRLRGRARAIEG